VIYLVKDQTHEYELHNKLPMKTKLGKHIPRDDRVTEVAESGFQSPGDTH